MKMNFDNVGLYKKLRLYNVLKFVVINYLADTFE